jgi:hypothetical protein
MKKVRCAILIADSAFNAFHIRKAIERDVALKARESGR